MQQKYVAIFKITLKENYAIVSSPLLSTKRQISAMYFYFYILQEM